MPDMCCELAVNLNPEGLAGACGNDKMGDTFWILVSVMEENRNQVCSPIKK